VSTIVRFESERETLLLGGRGWTLVEHSTFATVAQEQAKEAEVMAEKGHRCTRAATTGRGCG
jgi:hypothetical protein